MNTMNSSVKKMEEEKRFHQFIRVERGPVNSAIIDLLKGNVYQVENNVMEKFESGTYDEIADFMDSAIEEGLIIQVKSGSWIPEIMDYDDEGIQFIGGESSVKIALHVEDGVNLYSLFEKFKAFDITRVVFYGKEFPKTANCPKKTEIIIKEKNFRKCEDLATVDGEFNRISQPLYLFSRKYNSCWGAKIAVTSDGKIRPCIYSNIDIGNYETLSYRRISEKLLPFWQLTKDLIDKCKDCELRHICFDCREIAHRIGGHLKAVNPTCKYDPYNGTWTE